VLRIPRTSFLLALLLLSQFQPSVRASDIDEMPAEIWPRNHLRMPAEISPPHQIGRPPVHHYASWDFGLTFRIESLLCRRFSALDCHGLTGQTTSRMEFKLQDGSKISGVKTSSSGKETRLDSLAKKLILDSSGSPELKLPSSLAGKTISVSSTFHKDGSSRWVDVHINNNSKPKTHESSRRGSYDQYGPKNRNNDQHGSETRTIDDRFRDPFMDQSVDESPVKPVIDLRIPLEERNRPNRQMIEYKNENGEKRIKLIPVDSGSH